MCLFLDISCRVSDIIPAEWHRQGSRVTSTSSIIGQPRARLNSVESTLLSIVLVVISTQHEDDKASQRRLTTVCKSQPSTSQTDCIESTLHSVASVVTSWYLNTQSPTLSAGSDQRVISQYPVTDFVGWKWPTSDISIPSHRLCRLEVTDEWYLNTQSPTSSRLEVILAYPHVHSPSGDWLGEINPPPQGETTDPRPVTWGRNQAVTSRTSRTD